MRKALRWVKVRWIAASDGIMDRVFELFELRPIYATPVLIGLLTLLYMFFAALALAAATQAFLLIWTYAAHLVKGGYEGGVWYALFKVLVTVFGVPLFLNFSRGIRNAMSDIRIATVSGNAERIGYLIHIFWLNICLFAALYYVVHAVFPGAAFVGMEMMSTGPALDTGVLVQSMYFSVATVTTLGYGDIHPTHWTTMLMTSVQVLHGMGIVVVYLGNELSGAARND